MKTISVIGTGMGALSAAALLAKRGAKVRLFEQNYLPGGCTSSYWRKGFVFEAGATTLVGLDQGMPLAYLLKQIPVKLDAWPLDIPMQVHLPTGELVTRYRALDQWIAEAERVFGKAGQRAFWEYCYAISQFVWDTSLKQLRFPPETMGDLLATISQAELKQIRFATLAFRNTTWLLKKFGLDTNELFCAFVDQQLLISAQNYRDEVNALFGATALCYTNYGNYYMPGGLINLVNPLLDFIQKMNGELHLRTKVEGVEPKGEGYTIHTNKGVWESDAVVFGIPLNNVVELMPSLKKSQQSKLLSSDKLYSAFQMGIGFKSSRSFACIHHQLHLMEPLEGFEAESVFVSLNNDMDTARCDKAGTRVMSVSTHIRHPETSQLPKQAIEQAIIRLLVSKGFFQEDEVVYYHSSSQHAWEKWTGRKYGFVGGYPQYMNIKPWQMKGARLDGKGAYLCGDTAYPGQGIPGTVLGGIIAFEKMKADGHV
ncbi:FAD-dependent oxidoreductase [Cytophagales bacterium LB-30]|uniref:FAD-dependent oxidoreductase n=1 Tax=Shiella aurantiaca TaxID=3058365 RepID=A0ABT8F4P3_9BACT|nr:FAD-dependent oxidoreductase [Shiella aurantiaca]MDN4165334.1 FAD-dependent oxidoreductase [Shiella aurantiaca]